jgi:hypothetical protein
MISQSIFLLAIDFYDEEGHPDATSTYVNNTGREFRTLGFSPAAILSVIILASLMAISVIVIGYIPYKRGMPLAGSNSRAISAACHPIDNGEAGEPGSADALTRLRWGVMKKSQGGIGHCGFSGNDVTAPIEGEVYAGVCR